MYFSQHIQSTSLQSEPWLWEYAEFKEDNLVLQGEQTFAEVEPQMRHIIIKVHFCISVYQLFWFNIIYTGNGLIFLGYQFSWFSWRVQSTNSNKRAIFCMIYEGNYKARNFDPNEYIKFSISWDNTLQFYCAMILNKHKSCKWYTCILCIVGWLWFNVTFSDVSAIKWRDSCPVSKFWPAAGHPTSWAARGL